MARLKFKACVARMSWGSRESNPETASAAVLSKGTAVAISPLPRRLGVCPRQDSNLRQCD